MATDVQLARTLMQARGGMSLAHAIALQALEARTDPCTDPWKALTEVVEELERVANRVPSLDSQVTVQAREGAA